MFGLGVLPVLILLGGMVFLPESPRWLLVRKRDDEASSTLERVRGNRAVALAGLL